MRYTGRGVQLRLLTVFVSLMALLVVAQGCGASSGGSSGSFPNITPPIKAATPVGLKNNASLMQMLHLNEGWNAELNAKIRGVHALFTMPSLLTNFENNFFISGPTVLFTIAGNVDNRISFFNTSTTTSGCLSSTPVAYTITPAGQATPVTMYAQCYTSMASGFTGDPGLILIGSKGGKTYVYDANGAAWTAAIATPDGSSYDIHAWYSAGIGNGASGTGGGQCGSAWDKCSYGVAEVYTNAAAGTFEMAVAGIGVGYCGIQFGSDGTNTYAVGSVDGGAGNCQSSSNVCVLSSDENTTASGGICSASTHFSVTTAIGIETGTSSTSTSFGPSTYPGTQNVVLNGTSTDAVHFGPTTVPAGVTKF